ncbi:MAG: metal ABC transporter solute-binding protein, Zn/Mn family [Anaerolineales bacterium]
MDSSRIVCLVAVIVLSAGCTTPPTGGLHVLATETFLGDITQNVAGSRLTVDVLLPAGVDPHEFQLTPQDAIKIERSKVLVINGLGLEAWLTNSLLQNARGASLVVATDGLKPLADPSGEHNQGDPHMWMNPINVAQYVNNVRDGLSKADPAGSAVYAANADAYNAQLKALDEWIRSEVAQIPPERRLLVTNHDSLGYFADAYGFKLIGTVIPGISTDASTSAQEVASLIQTIKSNGAPAIFVDVSENQKLADQIASESGAKVIKGLYVGTLSAPSGPAPTYIDMMKYDVKLLVSALR